MMNKVVKNAEEALKGLESNMTLMLGGFGLCGIPENSIAEMVKMKENGENVITKEDIESMLSKDLGDDEDKKIDAPAISSGTPILPLGTEDFICSPYSSRVWAIILLSKGPGAIALTFIFRFANLLAKTFVS